ADAYLRADDEVFPQWLISGGDGVRCHGGPRGAVQSPLRPRSERKSISALYPRGRVSAGWPSAGARRHARIQDRREVDRLWRRDVALPSMLSGCLSAAVSVLSTGRRIGAHAGRLSLSRRGPPSIRLR